MTEGNKKMAGNETPKDETRIVDGGDLPGAQPVDKENIEQILKTSPTKQLPVSGFDEYNNLLYRYIEKQFIEKEYAQYGSGIVDDFRENNELIKPFAGVFFQATGIKKHRIRDRIKNPWFEYIIAIETVDELHPDILAQLVDGKKENMSSHARYALEQIQKHKTDKGNIQIKNNPFIYQIIKNVGIGDRNIFIPKNPYFLLLPLPHQERESLLPLFKEAQEKKLYPFSDDEFDEDLDNRHINRSYTSENFPKQDHIFSLEDLFKIGDALKLGNVVEYMGKLQKLVEIYENAEKE